MSWRIDNIKIKNFKFFKDEFTLPVEGKNVLLYGENGSGKSSIYWSFYTMYQACLKDSVDAQKYFLPNHPQNLRNRHSNEDEDSWLKITFKNGGSGIFFEDSNTTVSVSDPLHPDFMKLSMAASDFMNYKFLASFFDFSNSEENDVFKVLSKEVFPFLNFRDSLILDDGTDSGRKDADYWWKYISKPLEHVPTRKDAPNGAFIVSSPKYRKYEEKLEMFNKNLKQELNLIVNDANNKLQTLFNEKVSLQIHYQNATFNNRIGTSKSHDGLLHEPKVIITAKMTDDAVVDTSAIEHPRSFFNEARLTCMSLALRLAFLDARIVAGDDFSPEIFIDDLLISLDMGCRLAVIPLLLKYSEQKQMFVFTHDRAFYNLTWNEILRTPNKDDWKRLELYTNDEGSFDRPVLICQPSLIASAKQKYHELDLSGCANTIRSACEKELKRILPLNFILRKQSDEDSEIQFNNLSAMIGNLKPFSREFFDKDLNGFPDIVPNLSNDRKLVMNPYSHDDIETPLFRSELKRAIEDVEKLTKVKKKELLADDEIGNRIFGIKMTNDVGVSIDATFVFVERMERVEFESIRYYRASQILVKTISDTDINVTKKKYNIRLLYKDIYEKLGFTAANRPVFENSIFDNTTLQTLSAM